MGGIIACICCYCCLTGLKPRIIEFLALLCNLVEIGFLIWGIIDIPWDDISTGGKIMYYITCGAIVVTFLLLLLLMCLRCGNTINTTKNDLGKCLCITMVVFDILAFILIIIAEIIIIYNMDDKDDDYNYNNGYYGRGRRRHTKYSDTEWAATILSMSAAELALVCHCYCANFLLKLISAKTDLSYLKYLEQKDKDNIITKTINVFNSPTTYGQNQLTFIGYDKNGHPIYSGSTQYFTQVTNPNNTTNTNITENNK